MYSLHQICLVVLAGLGVLVSADCCPGHIKENMRPSCPSALYCDDGSCATPFCGVGKCNFAGCECDGGQLALESAERVHELTAEQAVAKVHSKAETEPLSK